MENLKIGTWNIKNSYFNIKKNEKKASGVRFLLDKENLDILTLQEVNPLLARKIALKLKELDSDYTITTTYQKTVNPVKNLRIEYNMIISKMTPILANTTEDLPSIPNGIRKFCFWNLRNRNMVSQLMPNNVIVNTTHLDHSSIELGKRQMNEVLAIVAGQKENNQDVILTGNLNRKPSEENMINFQQELSNIGMQVIYNPYKTYIGHTEEEPVDYIIVPNSWQIDSVKTLDEYDNISSHRPVVAETKKR